MFKIKKISKSSKVYIYKYNPILLTIRNNCPPINIIQTVDDVKKVGIIYDCNGKNETPSRRVLHWI